MGFTKEDVQRVKLEGFLLKNNGETFSCRVITGNAARRSSPANFKRPIG